MINETVSDERLKDCIQKLAALMTQHWEQHRSLAFEPILNRLEQELKDRQHIPEVIQRAQSYLNPTSSNHLALVSKLDPDP